MSLRIRLKRLGRHKRPFYRIVASQRTKRQEGREVEVLGTYDPLLKDEEKSVVLKRDRVKYWLGVGAEPSETVASLLRKRGLL